MADTGTIHSISAFLEEKKPEVSWHDHLVMLLHVGAEIEHGLMLQYLYCVCSIDTSAHDETEGAQLEAWRETILGVTREEMGHFITLQNVVRLLGAPMNLSRRDFPWDMAFYPFPFCLEPFTTSSIAAYTFTESPPDNELEKGVTSDARDGIKSQLAMWERYTLYLNKEGRYTSGTKQQILRLVEDRNKGG